MANLLEHAITKLATVQNVDALAVATTALYAVPLLKLLVVDHIVIRVVGFDVGSKTTQAIASFGCNDATYDDYINSTTYTVASSFIAIKDSPALAATKVLYNGGDGLTFKLSIETGSDATTETWDIDVFGYLVDWS